MRLLLLFIAMPMLELYLLVQVWGLIGFIPTLLLVLTTATLGLYLLRRQGFATLLRGRQRLESGELPAQEMAEGLVLAFCGALLLTPGLITDTIGFCGLVPALRKRMVKKMLARVQVQSANFQGFQARGFHGAHSNRTASGGGETVQGEFSEVPPDPDEQKKIH